MIQPLEVCLWDAILAVVLTARVLAQPHLQWFYGLRSFNCTVALQRLVPLGSLVCPVLDRRNMALEPVMGSHLYQSEEGR